MSAYLSQVSEYWLTFIALASRCCLHILTLLPLSLVHVRFALYMGFAGTLFFTCFCRMAIMNHASTRRDIRWSFTALGVASIFAFTAPLFGYEPDGMATMLIATITCVQVATSYHWRNGLPSQYQKEKT